MKFLDKMYKYVMDPTRTVQSGHDMRDGRSETNIPPNNFVVRGIVRTRLEYFTNKELKIVNTNI